MTAEIVHQSVRFEIITDVGTFLFLKPHWDNLFHKSADYNFSQSFEWCSTSWKIGSEPQRHKLYCLVGWVDDRVIIIWPFVGQRRALWSFARPLGTETTEYSDVLVEDGPEADCWVVLALQKLRTTCRSDVITLPNVRAGSRLHRILSRERPMSVEVSPISSVSWDGYQEWENYYRSLHRDFRYLLRNRRRRLAERGNLTFEAVTEHGQYSPIIDWLFLHKTEWLMRTNHSSPWQDTEIYKKQLIAVAAESKGIGHVMLFVLKLEGEIIAAVLGRISQSSAETVVAAFDQTYSKYGPGQLLYEDILKWAFERRLEFDFRIGDDRYKRSWINRKSEAITFRFINSIWGAAFIAAYLCRSKLRSLRRHLFR
jgi:CelD/BcsL family acetyltransferase involved in cellulose biosynthesis